MTIRKLLVGAVLAGGAYAYVAWDNASATIEARMLDKSSRFLGAVRAGDRAAVTALVQSESEALEAQEDMVVVASGEFTVEGLDSTEPEEPKSFWDPGLLAELGRHARGATSYSVNTYPDLPSLTYHYDCRGQQGKCLEHLRISFTERAGKVQSWIAFWNQPDWRELWAQYYAKDLETKPCGAVCAL